MLANRKQRDRSRRAAAQSAPKPPGQLSHRFTLNQKSWLKSAEIPSFGVRQKSEELRSSAMGGMFPDETPSGGAAPTAKDDTDGGEVTGIRFAADEICIEVIGAGLSQRMALTHSGSAPEVTKDAGEKASKKDQKIVTSYDSSAPYQVISSTLQNVNLKLPQGKIYVVVGAASIGKASLLRLLGKSVLPTKYACKSGCLVCLSPACPPSVARFCNPRVRLEIRRSRCRSELALTSVRHSHWPCRGEVFIPSHLSIVHVEQDAQLLGHMSLYENITLGYKSAWRIPKIDQICEVCVRLGLAQKWISHIRAEYAEIEQDKKRDKKKEWVKDHDAAIKVHVGSAINDQSFWQGLLSQTDRRIIQLARALLTNPHVLVIHRPLASLDEEVAECVLESLRAFIDQCLFTGASKSASSLLSRTVFFSSSTHDEAAIRAADRVIVVGSPTGGATLLDESAVPYHHEAKEEDRGSTSVALRRITQQTTLEGFEVQPSIGTGDSDSVVRKRRAGSLPPTSRPPPPPPPGLPLKADYDDSPHNPKWRHSSLDDVRDNVGPTAAEAMDTDRGALSDRGGKPKKGRWWKSAAAAAAKMAGQPPEYEDLHESVAHAESLLALAKSRREALTMTRGHRMRKGSIDLDSLL